MDRVKAEIVRDLHRPARRKFPRRKFVMRGIGETLQADLLDMQNFSASNRGVRYILTVIDVFSKVVWLEPLRNKGGLEVAGAFERVLSRCPRVPANLQVDNGGEFYNKHFQKLVASRKINMYSTFSAMKGAIIERYNRDLKNQLYKHFSLSGSHRYLEELPRLEREHNTSFHRTIGMSPSQVTPENEKHLLRTAYRRENWRGVRKFRVGDRVRLSKYKTTFSRGYTPNWGTEIFTVRETRKTNPPTYLLEDFRGEPILGAFYEPEMLLASHPDVYLVEKVLKTDGKRQFVKWLGLGSEFNSWISGDEA